ncbi:Sulfhydryl oxidase 1 (Quiescin-sulfhydryl oxidase 1) (OsQSOX1) [Durusdinium trenchii]|uniref:Sulfhydryl oxidase 1 (Quiescin-sulfhydryl oxidase 1) (OsQSOX1) n=1 Tax=Durusdinium trenchii TaxID=1381693 RepID=A0ABP0KP02_9DINO
MAKMCSGGVMTETRLDVLLLSPHLRPPISQLYLREATGFYASRIHYFKGKNWQIRSLKDGPGCFFIVPVIVNTGGSAYNRPIISDVLLKHFIPKFDRAIWGEKSTKGKIHLPTPLGDDFNLGAQGWNDAREKELDNMAKEEAIMYNLVGHELANVIVQCDGLAGNLQAMREDNEREDFLHEYYQKTVEATAKRFKHVGATADGIKREVESMMLDPMTDWGKSSLPVPALPVLAAVCLLIFCPQGSGLEHLGMVETGFHVRVLFGLDSDSPKSLQVSLREFLLQLPPYRRRKVQLEGSDLPMKIRNLNALGIFDVVTRRCWLTFDPLRRMTSHDFGLSLQNDFWFNHLRGIAPAHDHVSYVGALSQRAGSFDALPIADFYLLMVYSPWWQHCRRAVVEFNRLAAVLRPADLRPLLMDCTRPVNEKMCSRFLGDPRRPLCLGRPRLAVARLLPGEITAETMLRWVQRARPEALGRLAEKADLDDLDGWDRFQESDVRAGLALWLHEIFERQVFEIKEEDHRERRRNALLTFLDLLCSYFPDHLPGPSKNPRDCRESLCHLGWLLQDQKFWSSHIENIEVAVQEAPPEGRPGDEPQKPAELKPSTRRFQRLRWEKLEHHWQLCGEPWPELAARGFSRCRSKDPLASGLPCGVWGLMHSVLTEIAELRQCTMAHAENPDDCIGPPKNTTAKELRTFMKEEAQNMKVLEAEQRREFLDEEPFVGPAALLVARHRFRRAEGLSEESQEALEATYQVAQAMAAEGQHREAVKLFAYLHKIYQRKKGDTHLDTLAVASARALSLHALGSHADAAELQETTLVTLQEKVGLSHPRTVTESNNLALTLTSLGRHDEAVPLLRMTLDARELQNGLQTTEWITAANNLAGGLSKVGDLEEASEARRRTGATGGREDRGEDF